LFHFQDWLRIIGLGGVITSLVFVGFEIQQSRQIAVADVYQQRTAVIMQLLTSHVGPEAYEAYMRKVPSGEELDAYEKHSQHLVLTMWFSHHENSHFQNKAGLLSEEHWETGRSHLRSMLESEVVRDWWQRERSTSRASFAAEVGQLIED
jgi:hypothetical protein